MRNEVSKTNITEEAVSQLIGTLKRVEAPKDFEFRVKARIAAGRPVEKKASWLPSAVRYAVPLGLVLAVGGYVGLNAVYSPKTPDAPVIAKTEIQTAPVQPAERITAPTRTEVETTVPSNQTLAVKTSPVTLPPVNKAGIRDQIKRTVSTNKSDESTGGSTDMGLGISNIHTPVTPGSEKSVNSTPPAANAALSAGAILAGLGVRASNTGAGWRVDSVAMGSAAERSGVKAGDIVAAVNGQGKSLIILRDGVKRLIAIQ